MFSALLLGFVGSLHCIGMCGPLALLLPADTAARGRFVAGRVLYNLGRVSMYGLVGLLIGLVGEQMGVFFSQKGLSIALGAIILLILLLPKAMQQKLEVYGPLARLTSYVKRSLSKLYQRNGFTANYLFGLINGLLPCGLVYAALAGAFLQGDALRAGGYMLLFGVGTMPMMLGLTIGAGFVKSLRTLPLRRLIPITYGLVAIWLILRGFNVNLPNLYSAPDANNIPECHTN